MRVKLVYAQVNAQTITTTAVVTQCFRGNSCFDPDLTGTGQQPYNYDDFAVEYKRYRVYGCKIEVQILNGAVTARGACTALVATNTSTSFTAVDNAMSCPGAKYIMTGGIADTTKKLSMNMKTSQVLGDRVVGDRFEALTTADPADPWFYHIASWNNDGATTNFITLNCRLTYDVEFFDRNVLTLDFLRNFLVSADERKKRRDEARSARLEKAESKECKQVALPDVPAGWTLVKAKPP